jgi:superfamily II DNA/RNA helicase
MLIKNNSKFVRNSFNIPIPIEKFYLCKLSSQLSTIKNFINSSVLEKINANDITGAIKDLGGKNETESNIIELVCRELNRELSNKEMEKEYINNLDISSESKLLRLKNINIEIDNQKEKIKNLTERISELSTKTCSICMDFYKNPIMLECTHIYCGNCLLNWINISKNSNCPSCRTIISPNKITAITNEESNENNEILENIFSKEDTFINIIKNKINGKFLVFSRIDNGFDKIKMKMIQNNIKFELLKGTTSHMMNVLNRFKNGDLNIILLNTQYAGSGIDINFATDVIIFHSMGLDKQQAIGRAQRVGRTDQLYIHNLCYEHEM